MLPSIGPLYCACPWTWSQSIHLHSTGSTHLTIAVVGKCLQSLFSFHPFVHSNRFECLFISFLSSPLRSFASHLAIYSRLPPLFKQFSERTHTKRCGIIFYYEFSVHLRFGLFFCCIWSVRFSLKIAPKKYLRNCNAYKHVKFLFEYSSVYLFSSAMFRYSAIKLFNKKKKKINKYVDLELLRVRERGQTTSIEVKIVEKNVINRIRAPLLHVNQSETNFCWIFSASSYAQRTAIHQRKRT